MLATSLQNLINSIQSPSQSSQNAARKRQDKLTKPRGALGRLEELSIWLAGIQNTEQPKIQGKTVIVCAADHGVTAEGISAYPSAVTPAMVHNFLAGGAGINAIARVVGAKVKVLDLGVAAYLEPHDDLIQAKVRFGTRNLRYEAAMTREETITAILAGAKAAKEAIEDGTNLLVAGDMGIGNTTAASALTIWYANTSLEQSVGRGTGIDDPTLKQKRQVVQEAITRARNATEPNTLTGLTQLGGLEIAAIRSLKRV
jgi:nicotinate-nucleotide--dimethylbenzimidazole phosphoribosyltransferase